MGNEKWITINGNHIPIFEGENGRQALNRFLTKVREKRNASLTPKERGQKRFDELKKQYKDKGTLQEGKITYIELNDNASSRHSDYGKRGYYKDTTQEELGNMPIRFTVYGKYGNYAYIYKNQREWLTSMREQFGGLEQVVGTGKDKSLWSVTSESGLGEFYLKRNRFAKGNWAWYDANGEEVLGTSKVKRQSDEAYDKRFDKKMRKEHPEWY